MNDTVIDNKSIAFLGLGLMGTVMCHRLLQKNYNVVGYNRTAANFSKMPTNFTCTETPSEAINGADIIISMFTTDTITEAILLQPTVIFKQGAIVVDCCSGTPSQAQALHKKLSNLGVSYIDCPVSGGVVGAEAGALALMAGGERTAFEAVENIIRCFGSPYYMGTSGTGQVSKLANQIIVASTIAAISEAFIFAEKNGASLPSLKSALSLGFASSRILDLHGERMLSGNFAPGGTIQNQIKDLDNVSDLVEYSSLELPLTDVVKNLFQASSDVSNIANLDHSALFLHLKNIQKPKL